VRPGDRFRFVFSARPVSQETCPRCDSPTNLRDQRLVACTTLPPEDAPGVSRSRSAYTALSRMRLHEPSLRTGSPLCVFVRGGFYRDGFYRDGLVPSRHPFDCGGVEHDVPASSDVPASPIDNVSAPRIGMKLGRPPARNEASQGRWLQGFCPPSRVGGPGGPSLAMDLRDRY